MCINEFIYTVHWTKSSVLTTYIEKAYKHWSNTTLLSYYVRQHCEKSLKFHWGHYMLYFYLSFLCCRCWLYSPFYQWTLERRIKQWGHIVQEIMDHAVTWCYTAGTSDSSFASTLWTTLCEGASLSGIWNNSYKHNHMVSYGHGRCWCLISGMILSINDGIQFAAATYL